MSDISDTKQQENQDDDYTLTARKANGVLVLTLQTAETVFTTGIPAQSEAARMLTQTAMQVAQGKTINFEFPKKQGNPFVFQPPAPVEQPLPLQPHTVIATQPQPLHDSRGIPTK